MKRKERDDVLKCELVENQLQGTDRQLAARVHELKQSQETITRQHQNYSMLLKETDRRVNEKDEEIEKLKSRIIWLERQ